MNENRLFFPFSSVSFCVTLVLTYKQGLRDFDFLVRARLREAAISQILGSTWWHMNRTNFNQNGLPTCFFHCFCFFARCASRAGRGFLREIDAVVPHSPPLWVPLFLCFVLFCLFFCFSFPASFFKIKTCYVRRAPKKQRNGTKKCVSCCRANDRWPEQSLDDKNNCWLRF